jgi:hypothetical protein
VSQQDRLEINTQEDFETRMNIKESETEKYTVVSSQDEFFYNKKPHILDI